MRRPVAALSVGVLAFTGACATATGTTTPTRFGAPTAERPAQPTQAEQDSLVAQAIADREGPRVDVRAEVTQLASSRRVSAAFHVEDDSYVLIGQVDASGTVRIVFPTNPQDDGFVRGGKTYQTPDFFAGFPDEYRYRFSYARYYRAGPDLNAYDGALGYLFIVASWRPMHFEKFATNGAWDSFELADDESLRDPKPAIYELASLLAGENREAYTVRFAKYFNTLNYSPGFSALSSYSSLGYGAGLCSGYNTMGWASLFEPSVFGPYGFEVANGLDFTYRGTSYLYSPVGDCYYRQPAYFGNPFIINGPPRAPTPPHMIAATDTHRRPIEPRQPPGKIGPVKAQDVDASTQPARTSPTYRQRGLLTDDDTPTKPSRREPRTTPLDGGLTRPSIQQMVGRHLETNDNNDGWARATRGQANDLGNRSWARSSSEPRNEPNGYNPPRMRTENAGQVSGRDGYSGYRGADSPRSAPMPRSEPASTGYTAPSRVSSPTSSPAPSSASSAPRSAPASSSASGTSSSSSSGTPIKPPAK